MLKKYLNHPEGNPDGYWFKKELYGVGWAPVNWQGWLILGIYIAIATLVILSVLLVDDNPLAREVTLFFVLPMIALAIAIIHICYKKG